MPKTVTTSQYEELEQAITEAGRDKVFALARAQGWDGMSQVPVGYWWDFCRKAKEMKDGI
jgi:hypothetical protein